MPVPGVTLTGGLWLGHCLHRADLLSGVLNTAPGGFAPPAISDAELDLAAASLDGCLHATPLVAGL